MKVTEVCSKPDFTLLNDEEFFRHVMTMMKLTFPTL